MFSSRSSGTGVLLGVSLSRTRAIRSTVCARGSCRGPSARCFGCCVALGSLDCANDSGFAFLGRGPIIPTSLARWCRGHRPRWRGRASVSRREQLIEEIVAVEALLARLAAEGGQARGRLAALKAELASVDRAREQISVRLPASRPLATPTTPQEKVKLFRQLFSGRQDVFPTRFVSRKTGKPGYAPACTNKFIRGVSSEDKRGSDQVAVDDAANPGAARKARDGRVSPARRRGRWFLASTSKAVATCRDRPPRLGRTPRRATEPRCPCGTSLAGLLRPPLVRPAPRWLGLNALPLQRGPAGLSSSTTTSSRTRTITSGHTWPVCRGSTDVPSKPSPARPPGAGRSSAFGLPSQSKKTIWPRGHVRLPLDLNSFRSQGRCPRESARFSLSGCSWKRPVSRRHCSTRSSGSPHSRTRSSTRSRACASRPR